MVNHTIVKTYTRRQSTVESSTYGSELVAARIATDLAMEIRYILRMLGVKTDGSALMLGDNKCGTKYHSNILSIEERHCAFTAHYTRETIATRAIR